MVRTPRSWRTTSRPFRPSTTPTSANIKRDAAIDLALVKAHARDPQLTRAALDMDEIKLDKDGKVAGLDAQARGAEAG